MTEGTEGKRQDNVTGDSGSGPPRMRPEFNYVAHPGVEEEVKRLVRENYHRFIPVPTNQNLSLFSPDASPSNDNTSEASPQNHQLVPAVFVDIAKSLSPHILQESQKELCTRQIDIVDPKTSAFLLREQGQSLRIRGERTEGVVTSADVCIKTEKDEQNGVALQRGEFEAPINDFEHPDLTLIFSALEKHYPRDQHPELYEVLDHIDPSQLREAGRIHCIRRRTLVELPSSETGIAEFTADGQPKRFVAEVMFDDNLFYIDNRMLPSLGRPYVLGQDFEIEFEVHERACEYNPDHGDFLSQNLTAEDKDRGRIALQRMIDRAGGIDIAPNTISKAERLLGMVRKILDISNYLQPHKDQSAPAARPTIQPAFDLVGREQPVMRWPKPNGEGPKEVTEHRFAVTFPSLAA
jgi:hypothetical protein